MAEIKNVANIADLFSASLDDLADLPAFETPPPGSYLLRANMEVKEVNKKQCVEASFEVLETVELTNPAEDTAVVPGTKFSTLFMLDNQFGVGNLKKFLKPFQEHFQAANIGDLVGEIKDVDMACLVKNRQDKNDPDKVYGSVTNITIS